MKIRRYWEQLIVDDTSESTCTLFRPRYIIALQRAVHRCTTELPGRAADPRSSDNNLSSARCARRRFIANISLYLRRTFLICIAHDASSVSEFTAKGDRARTDTLSSAVGEMI